MEHPLQQTTHRTQGRARVQHALERVRQVAKRDKKIQFTSLFHHVSNIDHLRQAYFGLKRKAAPGVDGVTWQRYGEYLETNLQDLSDRLKRRAYRAKPVRRVFIPKPDGTQRPLGVTVLEDKLVQAAMVMVLNAIYEEDFLGFSYGFRPGRGQHNALEMALLELKDRMHFVTEYLQPAIETGLIKMTIPDKPRSSKQRYRLTDKGRRWLVESEETP